MQVTRRSIFVDEAAIAEQAAHEARILAECGFDAIIIENMHDRPYLKHGIGPEVTACMAAAAWGAPAWAAASEAATGMSSSSARA